MRTTDPVLVTLDVWEPAAVNVIEVTDAVAPQVAEATASIPAVVPPTPDAPAIWGSSAAPSSRTAAVAAVLHVLEQVKHFICSFSDYWFVATPVRCCSVKVYVRVVARP